MLQCLHVPLCSDVDHVERVIVDIEDVLKWLSGTAHFDSRRLLGRDGQISIVSKSNIPAVLGIKKLLSYFIRNKRLFISWVLWTSTDDSVLRLTMPTRSRCNWRGTSLCVNGVRATQMRFPAPPVRLFDFTFDHAVAFKQGWQTVTPDLFSLVTKHA